MFFDHARAEVVLFGGHELAEGSIGDTWTFDGVDWVQHVPAAAPPDRVAAALAYGSDDGEALLFGGYYLSPEGLTTRDDTWVWDGDTWTQEVPAADPRGTEQARMAREPASDRMLLFPAGAFDHPACGPDAERSTCHTWIWDGQTWNGQLTAVEPPVRAGHAVATDGVRGVLLFGGVVGNARDGFEHLDDTWMWRDGGWHELHPEHHPSGRSGAATVGMPARQSVLLFGGSAESPGSCGNPASAECSDTWEWDGSDWREHDPVTVPHARAWHALAWDTGRRRAVLFGGFGDANGCGADGEFGCSDTWEWDGSDWSLCASAVVPEVRMGPAMVYDAARARVVLFGGIAPDSWTLRDTWEWNGLTWVEQHPLLSAPSRYGAALEYDPARHEAVLYGGEGGRGIAGTCGAEEGSALCRTTWTYAPAEASSHLVVAFDLRSSATIEPSVTDRSAKLVHSVHVRAAAGGLGHTRATGSADGERVPGYRVSVSAFGYGGWVELHRSGDATPDALEDWTGAFGDDWSCGEPWCEDVTIDEWMGADGKLHFDFAPLAPQGASPENGEVALDYVELRVRYWRTGCEPPYELNPEGTPDGTPCTDGKPETVGETCCRFECVVGDCEESPPR